MYEICMLETRLLLCTLLLRVIKEENMYIHYDPKAMVLISDSNSEHSVYV